ncbi:MAG: TadE/TadG family type IV pilus assembly protein [Aliidongia sp.]
MKSNDLSAVAQGMIIMSRKVPKLTLVLQRLTRDKRGAVTMIYALLILTMIMALGVGMDGSNALQVKYRLDLAADAASVACGEAWQNEMAAGAAGTLTFAKLEESANTTAQTQAKSTFLAQAGQLGRLSGVTTPTVTTNDGSSPITNGASVNCIVSYTATTPTYLMQVAGFRSLSVGGASSTTVNLSPYVSVYFILDTSASMMVGSTPADQSKIANFVAQYDTKHTGTASLLQGGDDPPCAFACHDETPFKVSDMQVGETNASNPTSMNGAGATTRFDVMRLALVNDPPPTNGDPAPNPSYCNSTAGTGQAVCNPSLSKGLLPYLRDTYTVPNARANLNTFVYSMYGFNEGINGDLPTYPVFDVTDNSQYVVKKTADLFTLATGVNTLTIGFNTHLNPPVNKGHQAVLPNLANNIIPTEAANPLPGTTTENPIIFVIIVTDGMNSDRNWNWNHATTGDPVPAGVTQETTSANTNTTTYCGLWKGASPQFSDGTPWWLGVNDECNNAGYSAGYWSNATHTNILEQSF